MVHGILQFTPSIAFRYVLHRCESRDIRCRESFVIRKRKAPRARRERGNGGHALQLNFLGADRAGVRCWAGPLEERPDRGGTGRGLTRPDRRTLVIKRVRGSFCWAGFDNDPSAGSPTETLLRLLLPLNDKVQWTSRDVAGSEPPTSPRSEHFTGPFNR